jgi:hypothetical protein
MLVRVGTVLLLLAVVCSVKPLMAQQPFFTDDPAVTPTGTLHVEFFDEVDGLQSSQFPNLRQNTANLKLNYGLPHSLELDLDVPYISISRSVGAGNSSGPGDTNLGVKWNFRPVKPDSHAMGLGASLYIELPTGNAHDELGSGLVDCWLNFIAQKPFSAKTRMNANLGFLFAGNTSTGAVGIETKRGHVFTGGISLMHDFTSRLTLGGEAYGGIADTTGLGKEQLQGLVGGEYAVTSRFSLTFGLIGGKFEASPRIGGQAGFTVDFPRFFHSGKTSDAHAKNDLTAFPVIVRSRP